MKRLRPENGSACRRSRESKQLNHNKNAVLLGTLHCPTWGHSLQPLEKGFSNSVHRKSPREPLKNSDPQDPPLSHSCSKVSAREPEFLCFQLPWKFWYCSDGPKQCLLFYEPLRDGLVSFSYLLRSVMQNKNTAHR